MNLQPKIAVRYKTKGKKRQELTFARKNVDDSFGKPSKCRELSKFECSQRCNLEGYIHTYKHTYIQAYIHTYTYSQIHPYIHTYTHSYVHTYMQVRTS